VKYPSDNFLAVPLEGVCFCVIGLTYFIVNQKFHYFIIGPINKPQQSAA
jgi:hypothetical protein